MGTADVPGHLRRPRPAPRRPHDLLHDEPRGEKFAGYWTVTEVDEPRSFAFDDGFAEPDFTPKADLPVSRNVYTFAAHDGGTRATYVGTYVSADELQKVLDMGIVEGATAAVNQIDGVLTA